MLVLSTDKRPETLYEHIKEYAMTKGTMGFNDPQLIDSFFKKRTLHIFLLTVETTYMRMEGLKKNVKFFQRFLS